MAVERLPEYPWEYTEGDRLPELAFKFTEDVTTYTEISAVVVRPDGSKIARTLTNGGIVIVSASAQGSTLKIVWGSTDLVKGKLQRTQVSFVDSGGLTLTIKDVAINVKERHVEQPAP